MSLVCCVVFFGRYVNACNSRLSLLHSIPDAHDDVVKGDSFASSFWFFFPYSCVVVPRRRIVRARQWQQRICQLRQGQGSPPILV